jgi:type II secretory pathway component PulF
MRLRTNGRIVARQVFAANRMDARLVAMAEGDVIAIATWRARLSKRRKRKLAEQTTSLLRDLAARMQGGAPAESALRALIEDEPDGQLRAALQPALQALLSGLDVVTALDRTGLMDPVAMSILRSGQRVRDMTGTIDYAIDQMIRRDQTRATFAGRLGWVGFEAGSAVLELIFNIFVLIPIVRRMSTAPALDQALYWAVIRNGAELFLFFVGWMAGAWLLEEHRSGNPARQDRLHRVPVLGAWLDQLAVIDAAITLMRLAKARLPTVQMISALARGVRGPALRNLAERAVITTAGGTPLGIALAQPPFSPRERMEIKSHRSYEHLARIMESIAAGRQRLGEKAREKVIRWLVVILGGFMALTMWESYYIAETAQLSADSVMSTLMSGVSGGGPDITGMPQ